MRRAVEPIRSKTIINEIERYLRKTRFRNRVIWIFGINTGLRVSDILGLNVGDIRNKEYVELIEKKTGKYKQFWLNEKLRKVLNKFIEGRNDDEPLFISQKIEHRLDRTQVYRILNQACRVVKAGETHIGTHTMRKTFGYHHYRMFKDVVMLQKIFNHSSPYITLRYIGIEQSKIDESYLKLVL